MGGGGANLLLPPANEVWGKVICLQVCVCPQRGGVPGPGGVWHGGGFLYSWGFWSQGVPGGDPPPPTATAAGGTHPTGMHSCLTKIYGKLHENEENRTRAWQRGRGGGGARPKFYYVDPPLEIFHYLSLLFGPFMRKGSVFSRVFRVIAMINMSREEEKRRATMVTNSAPSFQGEFTKAWPRKGTLPLHSDQSPQKSEEHQQFTKKGNHKVSRKVLQFVLWQGGFVLHLSCLSKSPGWQSSCDEWDPSSRKGSRLLLLSQNRKIFQHSKGNEQYFNHCDKYKCLSSEGISIRIFQIFNTIGKK